MQSHEDALRALAAGRKAWPAVVVDEARFAEHLAWASEGDLAALATMHGDDLYLAFACAEHDPAALRALDEWLVRDVPAFIAHLSRDQAFVDDALQLLRERLLIANGNTDDKPRIASFRGHGPLGGWLRVSAVRVALDLKRAASPQPPPDALPPAASAELALLKARYGAVFKEAMEQALGALGDEDRTMLRFRFVDGLTVARIGALLGVHASTVVRRVDAACHKVRSEVERILASRIQLAPQEMVSLVGLVESQLQLTLSRVLES